MNQFTNQPINQPNNSLIPYGWLRALMLFLFFFFVVMVLQKGVGELLNLLQKAQSGKDQPFDSIIEANLWAMVLVSCTAIFISVWVFRTLVDKQTVASLGFKWKGFERHAWTGLFAAIAMLGLGTLLLVALNYLVFSGVQFEPISIISNVGLMVLVAFSEELLVRGYVLHNLMQSFHKWVALAISALLFTLLHTQNPGQGSILPMIEMFVGGIMLGINYIYTKNLWFGIFMHFGWNFFMGPVLGYEVSGIQLTSVFTQNISGPDLWTGGAFGFEGSVLSLLLNVAVILIFVSIYEKKRIAQS